MFSFTYELIVLRHISIFKTIWCNYIHFFTQKLQTFFRGYFTNSCKNICCMSRNFLKRLFGNYVEFPRNPGIIILLQLTIQWLIISCKSSSQHCSMSCKNSSHPGNFLIQIQNADPCHPFMELGNNPILRILVKVHKTLNYFSSSISKKCRFNIVPLTGNRIKLM